jgi:ATP-dependent helicase HrpB
MARQPSPLPIDALLPELRAALAVERAAVVVAAPGAGKTTRVPPALLDAGLLSAEDPSLVMLQPRRVAARAAAARIADERGWHVGREVGYVVRFERRVGPETRLHIMTEGVLTRWLLADPLLEGVGAVVLDEFHERSLHSDLALALLREVQAARPDLVLVVMSATLDAGPVARFLGGCPVLRAEGRSFPVAVEYRPPRDARQPLPERVAEAVADVLAPRAGAPDPGDLLVFLPGMEEIRRAARQLAGLAEREDVLILPLHGALPAEDQDRALRPADRRKVILATNVAETSLTIDGVGTVIDSGLARYARHDPARGLEHLELGKISRASAAQRAGRAGRTGPGRCIRLWAERDDRARPAFDEPDIRRADLSATILALHAWGCPDPSRFDWYDPPPAEALSAAERLLADLGALAGGRITRLGHDLLAVSAHPRLARLLVEAARHGLAREGAALAALLSEKDVLIARDLGNRAQRRSAPPRGPSVHGRSDLLERLERLGEAERARFAPGLRDRGIDASAARRVAQARDALARAVPRGQGQAIAEPPAPGTPEAEDVLLRALLLAYPDRVARRRPGDPTGAVLVGGRGVRLAAESVVRDPDLFLALDVRDDPNAREARVYLASEVRLEWLEALFPDRLRPERQVRFDAERGRAVAVQTLRFGDLVLREESHGAVEPAEASRALAEHLAGRAEAFVRQDEAADRLLDRLACARDWLPEHEFPDLDAEALAGVVRDACTGRRTVEEVRRVPLTPLILGRLSFEQARALEELVPESLTMPSGSRIRLRYEPGRPPVLAVRLQELFGWAATPRIGGGRVPVLLHLLGPNFRPVQITDDLASFWDNTYPRVRKDLRARYPKHAWPDDPRTARPEAKGGRRSPG